MHCFQFNFVTKLIYMYEYYVLAIVNAKNSRRFDLSRDQGHFQVQVKYKTSINKYHSQTVKIGENVINAKM